MNFPILSTLIFLPLLSSLFIFLKCETLIFCALTPICSLPPTLLEFYQAPLLEFYQAPVFWSSPRGKYVVTARAKGLPERRVLYGHVFRNAMLIIISGFPAAFISMFFTGSLLIEIIFSLDGLGLLGFEATLQRDYPVMFGTLYIFTLLGLVVTLISDVLYTVIDPRIDFESRN